MPSPAKTTDMIASRITGTETQGATYTFVRADNNKVIYTNAAIPATYTLPAVGTVTGQSITLALGASAIGTTITMACQDGETFGDGTATGTAINTAAGGASGDCLTVVSDGTRWVMTQKGGTWTII